jgi:hypothetical protein
MSQYKFKILTTFIPPTGLQKWIVLSTVEDLFRIVATTHEAYRMGLNRQVRKILFDFLTWCLVSGVDERLGLIVEIAPGLHFPLASCPYAIRINGMYLQVQKIPPWDGYYFEYSIPEIAPEIFMPNGPLPVAWVVPSIRASYPEVDWGDPEQKFGVRFDRWPEGENALEVLYQEKEPEDVVEDFDEWTFPLFFKEMPHLTWRQVLGLFGTLS